MCSRKLVLASGSRLTPPSARLKKAAICSRVTGAPGQNLSLAGGLQPRVIPAAESFRMSSEKTLPAVSVKSVPPAVAVRPRALTKKAAI